MTLREVPRQYVTRVELAEMMGVSVITVDRLKADGMPFVSWGRRCTRYDPVEAMDWARNHKRAAA